MLSSLIDLESVRNNYPRLTLTPTQSDLDGAYAVKIFMDYHPAPIFNVSVLAQESGMPESRLRAAFLYQFNESLEEYWEKLRCQKIL